LRESAYDKETKNTGGVNFLASWLPNKKEGKK